MVDPPDGAAVERMCVVMTAAAGIVWHKVPFEQARTIRIMANAILLEPLVTERSEQLLKFKERLESAVSACRQAGTHLDGPDGPGELIKALFRGATTISLLLAILEGQEIEEDDAPDDDEKEDF